MAGPFICGTKFVALHGKTDIHRMQVQFPSQPLPDNFKKFSTHAFYFSLVPFFLFLFGAIYKPFGMEALLDTPKASYSFNITMIMCIVLLVVFAMRMILYFTHIVRHLSMNWYRMWCVGEIVACSFFVALYVTLIGNYEQQYLEILIGTAGYLALSLLFPYIFLELTFTLAAVRRAGVTGPQADKNLRFYDSSHNLKFVVSAEHILYIKADENYITVHYLEGDSKKLYELRASMKSIEDICVSGGILRCHRSYFVNPAHVKALRKDKDNIIVAELDTSDNTLIPISKTYYEDLVKVL